MKYRNRFISLFICILILVSTASFISYAFVNNEYESKESPTALFDTNNDNKTNAKDVICLMKHLVRNNNDAYFLLFDINNDGRINAKDIIDLMLYIVSLRGFSYPPSIELFERIKADFVDYMKIPSGHEKDLYIVRYYGEYDGAVLVLLTGGYIVNLEEIDETIAGCKFHYNDGHRISVWKDGFFYSIREAYNSGLLDEKQIATVSNLHVTGNYAVIPNPYGRL